MPGGNPNPNPNLQVETACLEGFDGMSKLVTKVLGAEAWLRMVSHACDLP